jgi:hypothetical protein
VQHGKLTTMEQQLTRQNGDHWYQAELQIETRLWHEMQQILGARHQMQQAAAASRSSWEGSAQGASSSREAAAAAEPDWLQRQEAWVKNQQEQLHWIY